MTRFGALVFLLLFLNISGGEAQQCQEFKDGFKNYFQCILNCYKTHFGPRFKAGDLCTSDVTIEDATPPESENGYRADQVELSLDCIAHQCMSEIPPSVCEDSSTPADSTVSTPASTSESGSTPSVSSSSFASSSGPPVSTGFAASSNSGVSNNEDQSDYVVDCEESTDVEAVTGNDASPASTTDTPTGSTDYSYEYYSDEDYAEANATSSSSTDSGKSEANAGATSANGGAASASASAQSQNNGNALPQNNANSQSQNNDKKGVNTNMQNLNNGNGYSYYGQNPQSFAVASTGNNYRQPNQQAPVSNLQYQNFGNQRSNQNQYYYQRPVVQPVYDQPQATKQNSALQTPPNDYSSNSEVNASSSAGNGKTGANADATSTNRGSASASASSQYQNNGYAQPQNNGNAQLQNIDRKVVNTNMQNSNNGNGYSYYGKIPQSIAIAGNDNNGRQINQQVPVPNSQYQNFGNQRNNQNQYYYQRPVLQPIYNQPQAINQNTAFQPPVGGNNLNSRQAMYSINGDQSASANNAPDYTSGYVYNNRIANSLGNSGGNLYGYNSGLNQNYRTGGSDGLGSAASANSRSATNGGEAEASASAFSSMSSSMSNGGDFNPSSPGSSGGPIRFNFGDDSLVIQGNQVQWHRNNQLMDSFAMN